MEIQLSELKNNNHNFKPILAALVGAGLIAVYFFLVMRSPLVQYLAPQVSKEDILSKADSFYRQFPFDPDAAGLSRFDRQISAEINSHLLQYAQYYKRGAVPSPDNISGIGKFPSLSVGYWRVKWKDKSLEVTFDFAGNLAGFSVEEKKLKFQAPDQFSEDDALLEAKYFLESLNVNTNSLVIANKDISKRDTTVIYKFTLKSKINPYPLLTDTYVFEMIGDRVIRYQWDKVLDMEKLGERKKLREKIFAYIPQIILWLVVIFIILILFIRKLRRDELEFKRALWLGIVLAVLAFAFLASENGGSWVGIFMGGGALGLLILLSVLILFPIAESRTREIWPEKLEVTDLLFQGRGVRETGAAILYAFFLTGFTLLMFGGLILAVTSLDVGYLYLERYLIDVFQTLRNAVAITSKNMVFPFLTGIIFLFFWPGYLRRKISGNNLLFIFLLAVSFDLSGLHLLFFHPGHLGAVLVFPIALTWAYFVYKFDLLTLLLSFIGVRLLLDLMLILLIPGTLFSGPGMAVISFAVLFFLLGVYLVFRPRSVKDYDSYVPEYVSRIAEKERFLKELEIARGVQMRFLPQKVPHFPSLEIVSLCQPAMEVGGDYYDFIQMNERYMTVLIGDVSGKGVSAAFYMTMVKGIIKTLSKKIKEPAVLLTEANEIFYENAPRDVFITIIYGIFDLKEKTLTVASAGHNPLIVCRHRTGKTEMVNPRGIALGLDHGERYRSIMEEKCIPIGERDIFVFYTDGVSEAMNTEEEIYGEDRLRAVIEEFSHLSPQKLQEKIVDSVTEFSGKAPQHDDLTMVVVKVRQG